MEIFVDFFSSLMATSEAVFLGIFWNEGYCCPMQGCALYLWPKVPLPSSHNWSCGVLWHHDVGSNPKMLHVDWPNDSVHISGALRDLHNHTFLSSVGSVTWSHLKQQHFTRNSRGLTKLLTTMSLCECCIDCRKSLIRLCPTLNTLMVYSRYQVGVVHD